MADKIEVEAAAFEDRSLRADDRYEDVELSPEVLSLIEGEGKEVKKPGIMSEDPDVKAILDKFGGDPVKIAEAAKAANRKMTEATEERNRLLDMYDGTNRRLNELENMMKSSGNPNQNQGRGKDYHYEPPFKSYDEWDPAGNPDHVWWMAQEAAARIAREEISRFKQENTAKTHAQALLERDDKFIAEHPELSDTDISYLRRESQRRGVRELPDVYALIYGSSGSREGGGGGGRNKSEADLLSLLVSRVGNNLNKPQGLRGTGGGGGGGSGKTRITLEDLQDMTPEKYARFPEEIRERIREALPAFSKGY